MIGFSHEVRGQRLFERRLGRVADRSEDWRDAWPAGAEEFYRIEAELFDSEGRSGASGQHAPLSPKYAARKLRDVGPQPLLVRHGHLRAALTGGGTHAVFRPEPLSCAVGTNLPYGKRHMKARPPISLRREQKARIFRAVMGVMRRKLRG